VVVPQKQGLNQYRFIDAGRFVVYGTGNLIYRVPATGAPIPVLIGSRARSGYDLAHDGAYVATTFGDIQVSPSHNHLWLANTMATGGVQEAQFSGIDDATAYVSTWGFIPAQ
jgi:hypothetical protein